MIATPKYNLNEYPEVYEPSEDTFLFLDALEREVDYLRALNPGIVAEIGSGNGVVISGLQQVLKTDSYHVATDINPDACNASLHTAELNGFSLNCLNMNLLDFIKDGLIDVILFNPPYCVTDSCETLGNGLNRAWAGGKDGREIINEFLCKLPGLLSPKGVCYMVIIEENDLSTIKSLMLKYHFDTKIVMDRKVPCEHLYVIKFTKMHLQ